VASSFPPPYCTQPGNDDVHYLTKICKKKIDLPPPPTSW